MATHGEGSADAEDGYGSAGRGGSFWSFSKKLGQARIWWLVTVQIEVYNKMPHMNLQAAWCGQRLADGRALDSDNVVIAPVAVVSRTPGKSTR